MSSRDPVGWMWLEALELVQRAERIQRRFFQVGVSTSRQPAWEPPADMFETEQELTVIVALPGVSPEDIKVGLEGDSLVITGTRQVPLEARLGNIHRLEIPYGRLERRLPLPAGRFAFQQQDVTRGCLVLRLQKLR